MDKPSVKFGQGMGLGHSTNDFWRSCRDKEKEETILYLLGICSALCLITKSHLGAYYYRNLCELSCINLGSLNLMLRLIQRRGEDHF